MACYGDLRGLCSLHSVLGYGCSAAERSSELQGYSWLSVTRMGIKHLGLVMLCYVAAGALCLQALLMAASLGACDTFTVCIEHRPERKKEYHWCHAGPSDQTGCHGVISYGDLV